nr:anti-sigma factor [Kutzneria buriramensis]
MSCQHSVSLGVYVLGSLEPGERSQMERHLAGCPFCQQELVRFSPLPGLLGRISLADLEDIDGFDLDPASLGPPGDPGLTDHLDMSNVQLPEHPSMPLPRPRPLNPGMGRAPEPNLGRHLVPPVPEQPRPPQRPAAPAAKAPQRPEPPAPQSKGPANRRRKDTDRKTSRRNFLAMAAILVAAVGLSAVFVQRSLSSTPDVAQPTAVWQSTDATSKVTAAAALTSKGWGTQVSLSVSNLPAGQVCQLVVHNKNGQTQSAGWWRNGNESDSQVPVATSYAIGEIDRMDVVTMDHKLLVDITPKA